MFMFFLFLIYTTVTTGISHSDSLVLTRKWRFVLVSSVWKCLTTEWPKTIQNPVWFILIFPFKLFFLDLGVFPIFDPSISRHLQVTTLQDRHAHVHCLSKRAWPSQLGYSSTSGFPPCSKHGDFNMFLTAKNEDSTWCVFQTGYWWDTLWLWITGLLRCIDGP